MMTLVGRAALGQIDWQFWLIAAAGAAVGLLILFLGIFLTRGKKPTAEIEPEGPVHDPFTGGSTNDRRLAARRGGQPTKVEIQDPMDEKLIFAGYVTDRSMGGLRLMLERPVAANQILNVRSSDAPQTVPWIQVQVRRCTQQPDKTYAAGCQFVKTPAWAVLLTFG
jgi:PilZ domain